MNDNEDNNDDLFGADSSDDDEQEQTTKNSTSSSSLDQSTPPFSPSIDSLIQPLFLDIITSWSTTHKLPIAQCLIGVFSSDPFDTLIEKLKQKALNVCEIASSSSLLFYDVIVSTTSVPASLITSHLALPKGILYLVNSSSNSSLLPPPHDLQSSPNTTTFIKIPNTTSTILRFTPPPYVNTLATPWLSRTPSSLQAEASTILSATVPRTATEINTPYYSPSSLSPSSIHHAVNSLNTNGFTIIKNLFPHSDVDKLSNSALEDFALALQKLKSKNVDLLNPTSTTTEPLSYHELAMREDLRCDIRNSPNLKAQREWDKRISRHPAILEITSRTMTGPQGEHSDGNFGLWNFGGKGPVEGRVVEPKINEIGCVMSLGGSADQAIHADTAHLYSHVQLPPHYLNLFLIGAPSPDLHATTGATKVGQTAFITGSHNLEVCARITRDGDGGVGEGKGKAEMEERIVRPSLEVGDCVVFDCRVLHFGLANTSGSDSGSGSVGGSSSGSESGNGAKVESKGNRGEGKEGGEEERGVRRPLMYVNYWHRSYHDGKNWDDREKLFGLDDAVVDEDEDEGVL